MKDLRFSIAALSAFGAFSFYLTGTHEADELLLLMTLSLLPLLGCLLLTTDRD